MSSSSNSGANEVPSSLEEENSVAVQKTGWVDAEGQKYYYDGNGQMLKGMQPIDGKWYYLDETTGALWTGGWKQTSQGRFWSGADGVVPYGINSIDGAWYYIDPNTGYLRFGFIDVYSGGRTYANSCLLYTSEYDCYRELAAESRVPVAKAAGQSVLALPIYNGLSLEEVDYICECILNKKQS